MPATKEPSLKLVIGCIPDQQSTIRDTLPTLMSAAVFADDLVVVCREADTMMELDGFMDVQIDFPFMEYVGADSVGLSNEQSTDGFDDSYDMESFDIESFDNFLEGWSRRSREADEQEEVLRVARLVESYLDQPNTLPLIYDPEGSLLGHASELSKLSRPTKQKLEANAHLGSGLIDRLPSFDGLDSRQIVEVRRQLQPYLAPFRSYVVETSAALVQHIRDHDALQDVINEVYVGKVRPALNELNSEWSRSSFGRNLLRDFGKDPRSFLNAFLAFGVGQLAQLPLAVSVGAAAASHLTTSIANQQIERGKLRDNRLFMLHELERTIADS